MKIWLYGAGGHALVVSAILRDLGWQVAGEFDDRHEQLSALDLPISPGVSDSAFRRPVGGMIVTVGENQTRKTLVERLGGEFVTAIHPTAIIDQQATIGAGSVVMQGAVIQTRAQIGAHAIINTGATIDHECEIGDFVHVSPNATLCGRVVVSEGAWIGAGAVVIQNVRIGSWATVGAGAVVIRDVPDFATVVGNPARTIPDARNRKSDTRHSLPDATPPMPDAQLNQKLLTIINQVLKSSSKLPVDSICLQTKLQQDLGFDSLELAELTVRIEAEFGVDVFRTGIVQTVGEVVKKFEARSESQEARGK
jgi:acetyltransferase EpsM